MDTRKGLSRIPNLNLKKQHIFCLSLFFGLPCQVHQVCHMTKKKRCKTLAGRHQISHYQRARLSFLNNTRNEPHHFPTHCEGGWNPKTLIPPNRFYKLNQLELTIKELGMYPFFKMYNSISSDELMSIFSLQRQKDTTPFLKYKLANERCKFIA